MSRARAEPLVPAIPLALDPRGPMRLDGETRTFIVSEGCVDIFARAPGGARRPLFRVEAGEGLCGVAGQANVEVLAVGSAALLSTVGATFRAARCARLENGCAPLRRR